MNQILKILKELRPGVDFAESSDFIEDYLLDSFDIMTLTAELEGKYDIQIQTTDIIPENFKNVEAIEELIRKCGATV